MTVAIPEAVGAVEGAGGSAVAAKTARGQVLSSRTARTRRTYDARVTGTRQQQQGGRKITYTPPERKAQPQTVTMAPPDTGNRYQSAILAEFLVAALVVAFAPLAQPPKDGKGGPSPYRVGDLGQLAAIGLVYFLLALWSGTGHGRHAAWFGFLILLGILFKKTANGTLNAEIAPLTGKGQAKAEDFGGGDIGTQPPSGGPTGNFS